MDKKRKFSCLLFTMGIPVRSIRLLNFHKGEQIVRWQMTVRAIKVIIQGGHPPLYYDAHACGEEVVALQATRTRRSSSLCEP